MIPDLPEDVVSDLSRDACLVYKLGLAVQTGIVPPSIAAATSRPTKAMKEIVSLLVNLYIPNYFNIKKNSHCQQGAVNFYNVIKLSKDLSVGSRETVERVLQDNAY